MSDMEQTYFQSALSDFVFDMASGGAIRHLADMGCTVRQIQERLDFPTPYERIQRTVWEHLTDTGVIFPENPGQGKTREKMDYVREYDDYGRPSFRRVAVREAASEPSEPCLICAFGLLKYQNPERYEEVLRALEPEQAEYIEGLPWSVERVLHRPNRRMLEIYHALEKAGLSEGICFFP